MAPKSINPPDMELHESEIAKPQPLRIIKRSQTVTGNSTYGTPFGGRGSSGSSRESQGSPTFGADRPLTVRKKRQTRASIADLRSENSGSNRSGSRGTLAELVRDYHALNELLEDSDVTPKANKNLPRTISAGVFLKQELQRDSNDTDSDRFSIRGARRLQMYDPNHNHIPTGPIKTASPKIPERHPSKSKNFFLRAIGMHNDDDYPRHIRRIDESSSKNTLIRRRLSRTKKSSHSSDEIHRLPSTNSYYSFTRDPSAVIDMTTPSRITETTYLAPTPPPATPAPAYVLGPQIGFSPESSSVETSACSMWVAIEITGGLQRADGCKNDDIADCSDDQVLDFRSYGCLDSMRIELVPGPGCRLTELIGDLHTAKPIKAGETRLIVAKICLGKAEPPPRFKNTLSDNLMSEIENDLGHTVTRYLTVRLTYKHSGFLHIKGASSGLDGGTHTTRLQTEAIAVIKRHNPQSAWSPRTSQTIDSPLTSNPVIDLIEIHLAPEQAREALRRLASERAPILLARRFQHLGGSSEETVKPCNIAAKAFAAVSTSPVQATSKISKFAIDQMKAKSTPLATVSLAHSYTDKQDEEIDPARKIWTEMRRHSRGGRSRHHRTSISADHYYSFADDIDCSPSRISSAQTSVRSLDNDESVGTPPAVEQERTRIMEIALKNKRSLGADTLRSIAPSVVQSVGGKKSALGGLGLGFGRSLGWGNSWW